MREEIVLKGGRNGLRLVWPETIDFSAVLAQLKDKLASATDFFTSDTAITVVPPGQQLTAEQNRQLAELLAAYGLKFSCDEAEQHKTAVEASEAQAPGPLVVGRTIRGGQKIVHDGDVIIDGDVNPGAEIIASGNIDITGTCRGIVHAGAAGREDAVIIVGKLRASQIRIANIIARAPDDSAALPQGRERARIEAGHVIIESVDK